MGSISTPSTPGICPPHAHYHCDKHCRYYSRYREYRIEAYRGADAGRAAEAQDALPPPPPEAAESTASSGAASDLKLPPVEADEPDVSLLCLRRCASTSKIVDSGSPQRARAHHDPDHAPYEADYHRLEEEYQQYVPVPESHGLHDAYLVGALIYGYQHYVHYAYCSHKQGDARYDGEEQAYRAYYGAGCREELRRGGDPGPAAVYCGYQIGRPIDRRVLVALTI